MSRIFDGRVAYQLHVSPHNIRTQITVYDGRGCTSFRSLALLTLLVLITWTTLFTVSQMAIYETKPSEYYKPSPYKPDWGFRPGLRKALQRLFQGVKDPQLKIEPLIDRRAPSVEVNMAKQIHKRNTAHIRKMIIQQSLKVFKFSTSKEKNRNKVLGNDKFSNSKSKLTKQIRRNLDRRKILSVEGYADELETVNDVEISDDEKVNYYEKEYLKSDYNHEKYGADEVNIDDLMSSLRNMSNGEANLADNSLIGSEPLLKSKDYQFRNNSSVNSKDVDYLFGKCFSRIHKLTDDDRKFLECSNLDTTELIKFLTTFENITKKKKDIKTVKLTENVSKDHYRNLSQCPEVSSYLKGNLSVSIPKLEELTMKNFVANLSWVREGGFWSPIHDPETPCIPRHRVGIVIPYRDRIQHLAMMLSWLHPLLRSQQLEYTIYVAEQVGNVTFNKGAIMNAGFLEIFTTTNIQCFVFHDVDLLAEDDRNMYSCPPTPRHLSVGVDTLHYKLPYYLLVGGVMAIHSHHFLKLNGYSNMYWGWGGEDDDMGYRMIQSGLGISRPPSSVARYSMIKHTKRKPLVWKVRGSLVRSSSRRYRLDGLNTVQYRLVKRTQLPLYTHLLLDVGKPPSALVNSVFN